MKIRNTPRVINKGKFGQDGANLIEALVFIVISLVLIMSVLGIYKIATGGNKELTTTSQILATQIAYRGAYSGQNTYGAPGTDITNTDYLPSDLKHTSKTAVTNVWNGSVKITAQDGKFDIIFSGVPDVNCTKLATINTDWLTVNVNGTSHDTSTGAAVTTAQAITDCVAGVANVITYTSN